MENNFDFDKYISQLSGDAPKRAPLPAPTTLPAAPANPVTQKDTSQASAVATSAPMPPSTPVIDPVESYMAQIRQESAGRSSNLSSMKSGSAPWNALPESPLSLIERAQLGWVRTPQNQQAILEHNYGKENVALYHNGKEGIFTVRPAGPGSEWMQADPSFAWHTKDTMGNIKDLPGDVAQFAGEYGLRAAAASAGMAQGMAMGTPAGPAGMAAGGLVGAAVGAGSAEGLDMISRAAMPGDIIGTNVVPQSLSDAQNQLYASMLFGAEQEAGGKLLQFGGRAAISGMAKAIERMSNTPAGRELAAKLVGTVSGLGEPLARIRVENPHKVAAYDTIASKDITNQTNNLGELQAAAVQRAYDGFQSAKQKIFGPQYAAIKEVAQELEYNPTGAVNEAMQALTDKGYIVKGKVPTANSPGIVRQVGETESGAIKYVTQNAQKVVNRISKGDTVAYDEVKNMISTLDAKLYESNGVTDRELRPILSQLRAGLKNHLVDTLKVKDADLAMKYVALDQRYGPIKEMMEEMAPLQVDQRVGAYVKKIIKEDGSYNSTLATKLSEFLGAEDPTQSILQMHVAKNSTSWTSGKKFAGIIPGSPALMAKAVTAGADIKQAAGQIPYLNEAWQFLKGIGSKGRSMIYSNPEAINILSEGVSGAAAREQQDKQRLLDQAGVNQ